MKILLDTRAYVVQAIAVSKEVFSTVIIGVLMSRLRNDARFQENMNDINECLSRRQPGWSIRSTQSNLRRTHTN